MVEKDERQTVTVAEAARILGVSRVMVYDEVAVGRIPSLRFGAKIVIPKRALDDLLANAGQETRAAP